MYKVSVIIPNYNHAAFLKQRIDSVLQQTFRDFEVIILDDCSTDNSREIIEQYRHHPKVSAIVYNEQNSGSTFKQWQKGTELAKGEYIWMAESDDIAEDTFLELLLTGFVHSNVGMAFCHSYYLSEINVHLPEFFLPGELFKHSEFILENGVKFIQEHLLYDNRIPNASAVLFRACKLKEIDFTKVSMRVAGDWYVYATVIKSCDIAIFNKPLNYFRFHEGTVRAHKKYIASDIQDMLNVLEAMMGYLGVDYSSLPHRKKYFLASWYMESLVNSKIVSANYGRLLRYFFKIKKMQKDLITQTVRYYMLQWYSQLKKL